MKKLLFAAIVLSSLAGCVSVPMAPPELDASVKKFTPPADKAGLYIFRNETLGAAVTMHVRLDNTLIGDTVGHTYLYKELAPGKHTISSDAENIDTIEVDAKPGTNIYVWQEAKMGLSYTRTKLHIVDEATGQKGVSECGLAQTK